MPATNAKSSATARIVVDQAGVDGFGVVPAVVLSGHPVGRVCGPATERGRLPGGGRGIPEHSGGIVEGGGQPVVEALQAFEPFLADGRPAQRPGFQLGAQVPLDRFPQPRQGDLSRCASVVRLRFPCRQWDPRVAARLPVVQRPPGTVVTAREQRQSGEAEHHPQPADAAPFGWQSSPTVNIEPALQRCRRRPVQVAHRGRERAVLPRRHPQDVGELIQRQHR